MNNNKALSRRNPAVEVRLVVVRGGCEVTEICGGAATEVAATVEAAAVVELKHDSIFTEGAS